MWPFNKSQPAKIRRYVDKIKMRLFNAAKTEEFWFSWSKSAKSIDQVIHQDLVSLVARSREQYANNDYVKRFVNLSQTNIVGENGISVQSTVKDRQGNPDRAVQRLIEESWLEFSKGVDVTGLMSRAEFESLVVQGCAIDGEAFVVQQIDRSAKYGVSFYLIDPLLCPVDYHDPNKNIISGVRYGKNGAPIEYYFRTSTPQAGYSANRDDLTTISASQCWHIFLPEWVGQKRGIPWTATALGDLRTLDGYIDAALTNARVGATKMGFFETEGDGQYSGEDNGSGDLIMDAEPGAFEQLPQGVKVSAWNPDYPHEQFGEFVSAHLRGISVGLGVSHHSLTGDMSGVNYTSSRTALLDERDNWKRKQAWLIGRLTRRMFESFVKHGIDFGRITFNGRQLREQPEFYYSASFMGRRWQWVDPQKEITAAEKAVALGVKSKSSIIREQGQDAESVWEEMARDKETMETLGLKSQTIDGDGKLTDNSQEDQPEGDKNAND